MNLEELIVTWKNQDALIDIQMRNRTLSNLYKKKSNGVLKNIKKCLTRDLLIIISIVGSFDILYFIIDNPYNPVRWICFAIFNLTAFLHIALYLKALNKIELNYDKDLETNLKTIIQGLTQFGSQHKLLNIPVVFVCTLMFAGSLSLLFMFPWIILEFLFWRWVFLSTVKLRFEDYKSELEYTLTQLLKSDV